MGLRLHLGQGALTAAAVDWSKLDAGLAAALEAAGDDDRIEVFVHDAAGDVRTAALTPTDIHRLSHDDGVRRIALSRRLRLLDDDD